MPTAVGGPFSGGHLGVHRVPQDSRVKYYFPPIEMAILGYAANEYRLFWTNPCANWILPVMEFGDSSTSMNKLGITPGQNHQTPVFDLAVKIAIPLFQSHMARPSFGRPRAWWRRMWWP